MKYVFSHFELSGHIENLIDLPLSWCFLSFVCFQISHDLSLSYDHNTTSDISPVLFDLLSSHLNQDQISSIFFFFCNNTYSCYLLFAMPHFLQPLLSHNLLWETGLMQPKNKCLFLSLCQISVRGRSRGCGWRSRGRQSRVCTKAILSKNLKGSKETSPFYHIIIPWWPPPSVPHIWTNSWTWSLVSRENQDHMVLFLILKGTLLKFPQACKIL